MAKFKKNDTPHTDENLKHSELLNVAVESLKWYDDFAKFTKLILALSYEVKHVCLCYKISIAWQCHLHERKTKSHFHTKICT